MIVSLSLYLSVKRDISIHVLYRKRVIHILLSLYSLGHPRVLKAHNNKKDSYIFKLQILRSGNK